MRSTYAQYSGTLLQSKISKGSARKGIAANDKNSLHGNDG
jgi:hypothetical protein